MHLEDLSKLHKDPKTALQEWSQNKKLGTPHYAVLEAEGPAHAPAFKIEVRVQGLKPEFGEGRSKREAQMAAAQALLYKVETLRSLDGVCERAVQSFGLFRRSLDARAASAPKARALVLALRINTATPVSFSHLKSVLGSSWEDGALTTDGSLDGLEDVELPTSAEAQIGIKSGNYPLTVLTRIVVA